MTPPRSDGNRALYESRAIADEYESWAGSFGLFEPEKVILARLVGELAGGSLLDVGVGTGRTTPALSAACRRYVAIDYAHQWSTGVRGCFPIYFRWQDARDLSLSSRNRSNVSVVLVSTRMRPGRRIRGRILRRVLARSQSTRPRVLRR